MNNLKVGLFGIGLDAYWPRFSGLKPRLESYLDRVRKKLEQPGVEVISPGLIDTPEAAQEAGHFFRQADVDLIFLHATTYAPWSTVLPAVRRARVPVIVLNLQPGPAINYAEFNRLADRTRMTSEWLAFCSARPVSEIASVFRRAGVAFHQVTGMLDDDPACWAEVADWLAAARVAHVLEHNRLGVMGRDHARVLDIDSDLMRHAAYFGGHVVIIEAEELAALREEVTEIEIRDRVALFHESFDVRPDCSGPELECAGRTSVALDRLVERHRLGSLAYHDMGAGNPAIQEALRTIVLGSALLTARGVTVASEREIQNVQAMKILDRFGAGGSQIEYYAMDYNDDVVLMGHDGPGHLAIAEGKLKVRPMPDQHGKIGRGLSVEMSIRQGPVTLLSLVRTADGRIEFLLAEGQSVPGPILKIGNTNSRYRFAPGARRFVEDWNRHGPAHQCAVGVGHLASRIEKLGNLLGLRTIRVC